ncbi:MAG: PAS domain S-box protein, partial [Gammaproteobacteria bacterium]
MTDQTTQNSIGKRLLFYPLLVVAVVAFLLAASSASDYLTKQEIISQYARTIEDASRHEEEVISASYREHIRLLETLYQNPLLGSYIQAQQSGDSALISDAKSRVERFFASVIEQAPDVKQLRIIGIEDRGLDLVRLDQKDRGIIIATGQALQQQGSREYIEDILALKPEATYVSTINLNRVNGALAFPSWPSYRVAKPLHDDKGDVFGVLVMTVAAEDMLQLVTAGLDENLSAYLLDADGNFIHHPNPDMRFGFDLGNPVHWGDQFQNSQESPGIQANLASYRFIGQGEHLLAQKTKIHYNGNPERDYLELVVGIRESRIDQLVAAHRLGGLTISVISLAILAIVTLFFMLLIRHKNRLLRDQRDDKRIIEQALGGIIAMSSHGVINKWNRAAERITGYSAEDAIGKNIFEVLRFKNTTYFNDDVLDLIAAGDSINDIDLVALDAQDKPIDITLSIFPLDSKGDKKGHGTLVVILRDITEQRRLEQQVKNTNIELEKQVKERTSELEKARNLAMSASQIKNEFIANISHEIRTPIHGIFGMLRLLRQDPLSERQEHRLLMAETSVNELTDLINGILDISKIEAEKLEIDVTEVHLPTIIHNTVYPFAVDASDKNIELVVDCAEVTDKQVLGDPARIGQIFTNLVNNAIKYTDSGQVRISAKTTFKGEEELMLSCSVEDTGIGISREAQSQLFQPFSRGDLNDTGNRKGTGLGLAIVSQLCKLMDGEILVNSKKGQGAAFNFYLRLAVAPEQSETENAVTLENQVAVVVDSNEASANATAAWLAKGGAQTTIFKSFEKIDVPLAERIDVLVIDSGNFLTHRKTIMGLQTGRLKDRPLRVLVAAPMSMDMANLQDTFKQGTALLEKPVTGINLEDSLLTAYGIETKQRRELQGASDSEKQRFWNNLTNLKVLIVDDNAINQKVVGGMLEEYGAQVAYARTGEEAINTLKR